MNSTLQLWVEGFEENPPLYRRLIRALFEEHPEQFGQQALSVLQSGRGAQGRQYLLSLLLAEGLLIRYLCQPGLISLPTAATLAVAAVAIHPPFITELVHLLLRDGAINLSIGADEACRILSLLDEAGETYNLAAQLSPLLDHPDPRVQSKLGLLLARSRRHTHWLEQQLRSEDPRLRANTVEALWSNPGFPDRAYFYRMATQDPHNRVQANGWIGLYQLGYAASIAGLLELGRHPEVAHRCSALWAMGATGDPRFLPFVRDAAREATEFAVRRNALRAGEALRRSEAAYSGLASYAVTAMIAGKGRRSLSLRVSVHDANGNPVNGLNATQFVFHADRELVTRFDVTPLERPEGLQMAFALPWELASADEHLPVYEAVDRIRRARRRADSWPLKRFRLKPPAAVGPVVIFAGQDVGGVGEHTSESGGQIATDLVDALQELHQAVRLVRGARNVGAVVPPGTEVDYDRLGDLVREMKSSQTALHLVCLGEAPAATLSQACEQTAGASYYAHDVAQAVEIIQTLCTTLSSGYEATLSVPAGGVLNCRIQIYAPGGAGNANVALDLIPAGSFTSDPAVALGAVD